MRARHSVDVGEMLVQTVVLLSGQHVSHHVRSELDMELPRCATDRPMHWQARQPRFARILAIDGLEEARKLVEGGRVMVDALARGHGVVAARKGRHRVWAGRGATGVVEHRGQAQARGGHRYAQTLHSVVGAKVRQPNHAGFVRVGGAGRHARARPVTVRGVSMMLRESLGGRFNFGAPRTKTRHSARRSTRRMRWCGSGL